MKNKKMILGIAIILVIGLAMIACNKSGSGGSSGGGGKSLNSPEALKEFLDSQPANSPDKPIKVSMAINDPMLKNVADVIKSANKYVSLNIIGDALTSISYNVFNGSKMLVGITIPNSVIEIEGGAFSNCTNLTKITIPKSVTGIIGGESFYRCNNLTSITFQGTISSDRLWGLPGDLKDKYIAGGVGTYTRSNDSDTWTKQ
jgi:hypothetical protein